MDRTTLAMAGSRRTLCDLQSSRTRDIRLPILTAPSVRPIDRCSWNSETIWPILTANASGSLQLRRAKQGAREDVFATLERCWRRAKRDAGVFAALRRFAPRANPHRANPLFSLLAAPHLCLLALSTIILPAS